MANTTAYDLLKDKVQTANNIWQQKQAELNALRASIAGDGTYKLYAKAISDIDAATDSSGTTLHTDKDDNPVPPSKKQIHHWYGRYDVWALPDGTIVHESNSQDNNAQARAYLKVKNDLVSNKQHEVDQAKLDYDNAQKDLQKYESTSPIAAATVQAATAASNAKIAMIVGGIVLLVLLVVGLVIYNKQKNKAAPAAAAA